MKKKIIIISVVSVVVLTLIITGAIFALKGAFSNSSGNAVISIGNVTSAIGDKVKVPVKISGNPGFMAIQLEIEYDTSVLKYKNYSKGDVLNDIDVAANGNKVKFLGIENNDINDNGVLVYLEFDILEKASGSSEIKFVEGEGTMLANFNEEIIKTSYNNGSVKVK